MLSLQNVSAGYGDRVVVHHFSVHVAAGEIATIIGPNGCGKSTLLRCAAGLLPPREGRITIDGADLTGLPPRERARRIALLPQSGEGGGELTVEEMVLLGRTPHLPPYGTPSAQDRAVVAQSLQETSLHAMRTRHVRELSGGERQRVMLARALSQQPRVLLLDELTSNLDIRYQHELLGLVRRTARAGGLAILLVLHQINLAAAVADTMVLLCADGRTRATGSPREVMTLENLTAVYETPLRVTAHPDSGRPQVQSAWKFDEV